MHSIIAASLAAPFAGGNAPQSLFTPDERAALSRQALQDCGYATPQELPSLAGDKKDKPLLCLVRASVKQTGAWLPKKIEPGATITSVSEFEGMLIFELKFDSDHPRALVPENQKADYDDVLSNRTCQDKWLGGLIDAGMVDGAQGGTMVVYKLQNKQGENLTIIAVGQCFDGK